VPERLGYLVPGIVFLASSWSMRVSIPSAAVRQSLPTVPPRATSSQAACQQE
jgi:hypothetical protein